MRASIFSLISLSLIGVTLPLLMTSSCGRAPIESLEEPGGTINVTGAFSDWTPSTSSFAGGVFLLLDPNTNEVFKSGIIEGGKPVFKIENVPVTGKYYGILLDSRFEPKAYLEKTGSDSKKQRVFKIGSSDGNFGTIVVRDSTLESSSQTNLDFQSNYGIANKDYAEKQFSQDFTTNFNPNPDIDGDGIPNVIDTNVDGDSKDNIFDSSTYEGKSLKISDSAISSQYNYGYGINKGGYFKCDHLRTPTSKDNSAFKLRFSCGLKLPAGAAEKVELVTAKTFNDAAKNFDESAKFDWEMKDNGTQGDLISSDGIWGGIFNIAEGNPDAFPEQVILATATLKDGSKKTYITTLEPTYKLKNKDSEPIAKFASNDAFEITFLLGTLGGAVDGFQLSATIIKDWDDTEIHTFSQSLKDANKATIQGVGQLNLPATTDEQKYRIKVKISAPAAMPGLLGSAFEIFSETLEYIPPAL